MAKLTGKRILIVEDDVTNMSVYRAVLKRSGATVIQDFYNTNTVNTLKQFMPVDVMLLDLMLRHQVSGYDIFNELKQVPELKNIPVIAVSAADPELEIPKAKAMGFAGFIGKPIDPFEFPDQILACLSGQKIWYSPLGTLEDIA